MEGHASPLRNPHQYSAMRIAAEAGIAPRLYHVDETARVAVMDFIVEQPLNTYPGGPHALAQALGDMLRRLQGTPRFGRFVEYPEIVARLWAHVCRTNLFAPGVLDAHTQRLADLRSAYTWNSDEAVSSHNDILPRNLLFDGERLWLVDWESAYCNDPVVDMATMLDNFAPSPEFEEVLLQAWLGHPPDRGLRDRLELMRALTRLFYAGVQFSAVATASRLVPDTGSLGSHTCGIPASLARWAAGARCVGDQASAWKDVSRCIFHGRETAGAASADQCLSSDGHSGGMTTRC
jgi:hypothetical protein